MNVKAVISKDGIRHEFEAAPFDALRCKLGLHDWQYWHMAVSFIEMLPKDANVCRDCRRCGWMEKTDDGFSWKGRV